MAALRSLFQTIRWHLCREHTIWLLLLVIFFLSILSPLLGLGMDFLQALGRGTLDLSSPFLLSYRCLGLLAASIGFAAAVAFTGLLVGTLLVSTLWRMSRTILVLTLLSLLAFAAIPPYIHALTWSALMGYMADFLPGGTCQWLGNQLLGGIHGTAASCNTPGMDRVCIG